MMQNHSDNTGSIMNAGKQTTPVAAAWAYRRPAIALHWLIAVTLVGMVALGWYMMSIEHDPGSDWYFNLHKSVGITVFSLVLIRIGWRLTHRPAPLPSFVPAWQTRLSTWTQLLLYVCMVLLPTTGFIGALYSKKGVAFWGKALPTAVPNHDFSELLFTAHGVIVWVLVGLVALHVAGALKHLLIDRDGVFQRMW